MVNFVVNRLEAFGIYDLPLDQSRDQAMKSTSFLWSDEPHFFIIQEVGGQNNFIQKCFDGSTLPGIYETKDSTIKSADQPN